MKRILIIALASIFLVNMLNIITYAKPYDVQTFEGTGTYTGTSSASGVLTIETKNFGDVKASSEKPLYIKIAKLKNANQYQLYTSRYIGTIQYNNGEITTAYTTWIVNENTEDYFVIKITANSTILTQSFAPQIRVLNLTGNTEYNIEYETPLLSIYYEADAGDILIGNVKDAPKDVLREVVAVLPVLIGILIAYIATRKGIAFIRSILESA